jgi:hypothetical protein
MFKTADVPADRRKAAEQRMLGLPACPQRKVHSNYENTTL